MQNSKAKEVKGPTNHRLLQLMQQEGQDNQKSLRPVRSAESLVEDDDDDKKGGSDVSSNKKSDVLFRKKKGDTSSNKKKGDASSKKSDVSSNKKGDASSSSSKRNSRIDMHLGKKDSRPTSMEVDEDDHLASLEVVQRAVGGVRMRNESPKTHSRSSSHESYFERRWSRHFPDKEEEEGEEAATPSMEEAAGKKGGTTESALDLSEIQMNFDLEDNEMRIFSEDEAMLTTSMASDLSNVARSPMAEEVAKTFPTAATSASGGGANNKRSSANTKAEASPKARKMSFKEKLRRFTSPTPARKAAAAAAEKEKAEQVMAHIYKKN